MDDQRLKHSLDEYSKLSGSAMEPWKDGLARKILEAMRNGEEDFS